MHGSGGPIARLEARPRRAAARRVFAALLVVAGATLAPAAADASTVFRCGAGIVCFSAEPGETNAVYTAFDPDFGDEKVLVYDKGPHVRLRAGRGCSKESEDAVTCGKRYPVQMILKLGDGNDFYSSGIPIIQPGPRTSAWWRVTVLGEGGSDHIRPNLVPERLNPSRYDDHYDGGPGRDVIDYGRENLSGVNVTLDGVRNDGARFGEPESDQVLRFENITGSQRADYLVGDDRDNVIRGHRGSDLVEGKEGSDTLDEGPDRDNPQPPSRPGGPPPGDRLYGGPGSDIVSYKDRRAAVAVTIQDGANDGTGYERDDVSNSVEGVIGGAGNDVLIGSDGPDFFSGLAGNDLINPKAGEDRVHGGQGDDLIELRDGFVDHFTTGTGNDVFYREGFDIRYL